MRASVRPVPPTVHEPLGPRTAHTPSRGVAEHSSSIRGPIDDLCTELYPPADIARLLRQLGVPFATFDPALRCTELSPAAHALLGDEADHVCRLGARLLASMPGDAGRMPAAARGESASSCVPGGRHLLRAQRLPRGDPKRTGIVLVLPIRGGTERVEPRQWGLSRREAEVAALIARGASTAEVACVLGISAHTVRRHTERIYSKVGVRTRMQLAMVLGNGRTDENVRAQK
jgi:DNA-binding CsgD family transcriptional regulator